MHKITHDEMEVPLLQSMNANLEDHESVAVWQCAQLTEIFAQVAGIPYEQANKYKICRVPPVRRSSPKD